MEAPNQVARAGGALVRGGDGRNDGLVGGWRQPDSVEDELEPARDESQNWRVRELSGVVLKLGKEMARPEVVCTSGSTEEWPRRGSDPIRRQSEAQDGRVVLWVDWGGVEVVRVGSEVRGAIL